MSGGLVLAYRDMGIDPKVWTLKRVIPAGMLAVLLSIILAILLPSIFMSGYGLGLLLLTVVFMVLIAVSWPYLIRERKRQELDDELHLFSCSYGLLLLE